MPYSRHILPLLMKYCTDCGGSATPAGQSAQGPRAAQKGEALGCRGVAFAATPGWSSARVQGGPAGRRRAALRCALALGLVLAFSAGLTAAERTGLQREIRETREFVAEIAKAVRRVQAENLKVRRTLGSEVRNLTAEDVTVTTLRLGRLDADTARLHVTTLENRIAQREATLRLLEEDINRRAADIQGTPATTLETLGAQAELQQLRELRAVSIDLVDGLRDLRQRRGGTPGAGRGAARRAALQGGAAHNSRAWSFRPRSQGGRAPGDDLSACSRRPPARQRGRSDPTEIGGGPRAQWSPATPGRRCDYPKLRSCPRSRVDSALRISSTSTAT